MPSVKGRKGTRRNENVELRCPLNKGKRLIGNNESTGHGKKAATQNITTSCVVSPTELTSSPIVGA